MTKFIGNLNAGLIGIFHDMKSMIYLIRQYNLKSCFCQKNSVLGRAGLLQKEAKCKKHFGTLKLFSNVQIKKLELNEYCVCI